MRSSWLSLRRGLAETGDHGTSASNTTANQPVCLTRMPLSMAFGSCRRLPRDLGGHLFSSAIVGAGKKSEYPSACEPERKGQGVAVVPQSARGASKGSL